MALFGISRQYVLALLPLSGLAVGWFLDRKETERMVMFRDKSKLYGREMGEDEAPSWP